MNTEREVVVAKEIKAVYKLVVKGLIIGACSFPIFYMFVYEAGKYDGHKCGSGVGEFANVKGIEFSDFNFGWSSRDLDCESVKRNIARRRKPLLEDSIYGALYVFLIASGSLVAFRYIRKGAKWVDETSKK